MGIKLGGPNFDTQDFQVLQAKAAEGNVTTMAETEQQVIDKFEELNNIKLSGTSRSYSYSYPQEEKDNDKDYNSLWRPTQDINTKLDFSNIQLINSPQWKIANEGEIIHDTSKDTKDKEYYYRVVTYQYQINYKHFQESSTTISGNIWTNNARVIYHRKTCSYSYEEPIDDRYEGSDNISIILEQKVTWHWTEKIEIEDPVEATTFGAFPSGISADYCILTVKSDPDFVETYTTNEKIDDLNKIANDYAERLATLDNPNIEWETKKYFSLHEGIPCIYLTKDSVDNSEELQDDWKYLYGEEELTLTNNLAKCKINNSEELEDCYRVFLMGKAQLCGLDLDKYIADTQGGRTELGEYNFPNGYYFIIGRQLYLFLLTDLSPIDWDGNVPEKTFPVEITFLEYSTLIEDSTKTTQVLSSRINELTNERYYLYKGHKIANLNELEKNDMILKAPNLRQVVISDSITTLGYLSEIQNPTGGFYFPKYLEYLGPFTYKTSGSTSLFIYGSYLKEIADNAFGSTANARIYLSNNSDIEKLKNFENLSSSIIKDGYFGPTQALKVIGNNALEGLKFNIINLTNCKKLNFVGQKSLATITNGSYRILSSQQSERVSNKNLIYLPENTYNSGSYEDLTQKPVSKNSPRTGHLVNKKYSTDTVIYETLGSDSTACDIYVYHPEITITLDDLLDNST